MAFSIRLTDEEKQLADEAEKEAKKAESEAKEKAGKKKKDEMEEKRRLIRFQSKGTQEGEFRIWKLTMQKRKAQCILCTLYLKITSVSCII